MTNSYSASGPYITEDLSALNPNHGSVIPATVQSAEVRRSEKVSYIFNIIVLFKNRESQKSIFKSACFSQKYPFKLKKGEGPS